MQLNFYRKLNIVNGQTILLVNPTRTFQHNFSSNVPKHCSVLYKYKQIPVDIILYWVDKRDDEQKIASEVIGLLDQLVGQGAIWVLFETEAKGKEPIFLELVKDLKLTISKKTELYKNIYAVKLVKQ